MPKSRLFGDTLAPARPPTPVRVTDWVVGLALSVSVRVAVRVPAPPGVKVIVSTQLVPAAIMPLLQLELCPVIWKSPGSAPVSAAPVTSSVAVPGLDTVSVA